MNMISSRPRAVAAALVALGMASLALADAPKGRWVSVDQDEGIETWKLEIPGQPMPGFRGRTEIAAAPQAILREISRVEKHPEWMHRCAEARTIEKFSEDHRIVYNRTDSPWPAWDRDVVLETHVTHSEGGDRVKLSFENVSRPEVQVPDRVVRMPRLEGSYTLERVDEKRTRVTYQIEVDIGGSIPDWIAKRLAESMPYETLSRLRERMQSK